MKAPTFLQRGIDHMRDRATERDTPEGERSMARTVKIFNAWTDNNLTEEEGWRFMIALKQAREIQGNFNVDDYEDLTAYSGLLGECISEQPEQNPSRFAGDTDSNGGVGKTATYPIEECENAVPCRHK